MSDTYLQPTQLFSASGAHIEALVDGFEQAWQSGSSPPSLAEFLPTEGSQRREALVALVAVDLEYRWKLANSLDSVGGGLDSTVAPTPAGSTPPRPRVEYYVGQFPDLGRLDAPPLDLIAAEYRARHRWGDRPGHVEYAMRFASLAGALGVALSQVDKEMHMDRAAGGPVEFENVETLPRSERNDGAILDASLPTLPGYEILGPLGRGGMGVVYKARQIKLNRIVALKMIGAGRLADSEEVRRFMAEAQAAASLKHSNIVAIHEVGEHDGQPYFTMDCVSGGNLADLVREHPLPPEPAARYVRQVAEAIHYAHEHGILHRDLKPSNVLIDESDQPQVTDFGLARRIDEASGLTMSGMPVGTPSFMPPEQAAGRREGVGRASDVYSLGAMLYALVTGRPPFQGPTWHDTIEQVKSREPISPRQLQPKLPRDLETIVLKCLAKEPCRRYATADELACELRRWAAAEPIHARPVGRVERTRRWCRRNPRVALLSGTVVLLLMTLGIGGLASALVLERRRNEALAAAHEANVERQKSEAALAAETRAKDKAKQAVDHYVESVQESELLADEHFKPLRAKLLADALRYYQEFLRDHEHDNGARLELAKAIFRIGLISQESGAIADGLAAYAKAVELSKALAAENPRSAEHQEGLADSYNNLASLEHRVGELDAARDNYQSALAIRRTLAEQNPAAAEYRNDLASSYNNLGVLQKETGDPRTALESHGRALAIRRQLVDENPGATIYQRDLAATYDNLGVLQSETGDHPGASAHYQAALAIREVLAEKHPEETHYQADLAATHNNLGNLQRAMGRHVEAIASLQRALAIRQGLAEANPSVSRHQLECAKTLHNLGVLQQDMADNQGSLESFQRALTIRQKLTDESPSEIEYQDDLAKTYNNLGLLKKKTGDREGALFDHRRALAIRHELSEANPSVTSYRLDLATSHTLIGQLLRDAREYEAALASQQEALAVLKVLLEREPDRSEYQNRLATAYYSLGKVHNDMGHHEAAFENYRAGLAIWQTLADANPALSAYQENLAGVHNSLGILQQAMDDHDQALASYGRALEIQQRLADEYPHLASFQVDLGGTCCNLGALEHEAGGSQRALDLYSRAEAALAAVLAKEPKHATAALYLRNTHIGRAEALRSLGRHAQAADAWQRAIELDDGRARGPLRLAHAAALARGGDHAGAAAEAGEIAAIDPLPGSVLYNLACVFAVSAAAAADEMRMADHYARQAVTLLKRAQQAGFFADGARVDHMVQDGDLAALRSHDEYRKFLEEFEPVTPPKTR